MREERSSRRGGLLIWPHPRLLFPSKIQNRQFSLFLGFKLLVLKFLLSHGDLCSPRNYFEKTWWVLTKFTIVARLPFQQTSTAQTVSQTSCQTVQHERNEKNMVLAPTVFLRTQNFIQKGEFKVKSRRQPTKPRC